MSVPVRRGPWWYYARTEEGQSYAIHCRRPARGRAELPPAGEPGEEEQVLLDENVLAEGSDYFAVGSAAVSPDHRWLAYSTDRAGRREVRAALRAARRRHCAGGPEVVPETGYGLAWSADADHVFYVRFDEALRPFQLWRHRLGSDPSRRRPRLRGARPPLLARRRAPPATRPSCSSGCTAPTPPNGWPSRPIRPEAAPRVLMARREGVEYGVDHLSRRSRAGMVRGADQRGRARLSRPGRRPTPTSIGPWREVVPHRPGRADRGRRRLHQCPRPQRALRSPDRGAGARPGRVGRPLRRRTC